MCILGRRPVGRICSRLALCFSRVQHDLLKAYTSLYQNKSALGSNHWRRTCFSTPRRHGVTASRDLHVCLFGPPPRVCTFPSPVCTPPSSICAFPSSVCSPLTRRPQDKEQRRRPVLQQKEHTNRYGVTANIRDSHSQALGSILSAGAHLSFALFRGRASLIFPPCSHPSCIHVEGRLTNNSEYVRAGK